MGIGKAIASLRDDKGWSQNDLALKCGISRVMISNYERDEVVPSIDVAKKLADALDTSLDNLAGDGIFFDLDKDTVTRFRLIQRLDNDNKRALLMVIDGFLRDAAISKL